MTPGAGAKHAEAAASAMLVLPKDVLQHICSFLHNPDDLASVHLVNKSFCEAARGWLICAEPRHPEFLRLARQHCYPLRHLNTAELSFCDLEPYLAQAPSSLSSLTIARRTLTEPSGHGTAAGQCMTPLSSVLLGIRSLRSLCCPVTGCNVDFLQPLTGLSTLSLTSEHQMHDLRGLLYLTCLTQLQLSVQEAPSDRMLSELAELTALRCLRLSSPANSSLFTALSALSQVTALSLRKMLASCGDGDMAAMVHALPQLRALDLRCCGHGATDTGLRQLSKLSKLQHLNLALAFGHCTNRGLYAALANMTGLEALDVSYNDHMLTKGFEEEHSETAIARLTKLTALFADHLKAGKPIPGSNSVPSYMQLTALQQLQWLSMRRPASGPIYNNHLLPTMLLHCPLLAHLQVDDVREPKRTKYKTEEAPPPLTALGCTQLHLCYSFPQTGVVLRHVPELRCLWLNIELDKPIGNELPCIAGLPGLHCVPHLECLTLELSRITTAGVGAPLLQDMLSAAASCSNLMWLQLADDGAYKGFGADHLRALAAMPQLEVLNLYHVKWTADAAAMGLPWLADGLPRLRVLNAPDYVLAQGVTELDGCSYRLRGCCGRRLRLWPRRATLGKAAGDPLRRPWPVLESHRWLWE